MMCVSAGKSEGEIAWRRWEGIGSRGHVVGWLERRSLDTYASVRGQKAKREVLAIDVVGLSSCMCWAENWLLIELVLFVKKVAKSSAVKEAVGVVEGDRGESWMFWRDCMCQMHCWSWCGSMKPWQCGLQQRKMKAKTDRYSGLTDCLIVPFSLCCPEFRPMNEEHDEEHWIARSLKGQHVLARRREDVDIWPRQELTLTNNEQCI